MLMTNSCIPFALLPLKSLRLQLGHFILISQVYCPLSSASLSSESVDNPGIYSKQAFSSWILSKFCPKIRFRVAIIIS